MIDGSGFLGSILCPWYFLHQSLRPEILKSEFKEGECQGYKTKQITVSQIHLFLFYTDCGKKVKCHKVE